MGIQLVMVFDGAPMPCKENTEEERRQTRSESLKKAEELEKLGNLKEAERYYTRAVDVTPFLAKEVIEELQKYNIECIVAPYEADAQLAYLCKIGYVSGVISEDSDLIVFQSTKVLYKLENNGYVKELKLDDLWSHPNYNMKKWTHDQFVLMCVLAGCDYLKSVKSIGLKTAYKYVSQHGELRQIIQKLKRDIGKVPTDYEEQFLKALYSFKYHKVFCPLKGQMVNLNPVPEDVEMTDLSFLGETLPQDIIVGIARGRLHPFTKQPFNDQNLKRKIDEIFQPLSKPNIVKKVKIEEEIKSLAQQIRFEKKTQKSKYFDEGEGPQDENSENPQEDVVDKKTLPIVAEILNPFKPPFANQNSIEKTGPLDFLQNLSFRKISLMTIFSGSTN